MLRLSMPHGPSVFRYILLRIPRLALTSCPPINSADLGTEVIITLRVSVKFACSTLSTGWYTDATNSVMWPHILQSYKSNLGKHSFNPMNWPTNRESYGVVIGAFAPDFFHTYTAAGARMMATLTGILPLDPISLFSRLWRNTMWSRTNLLSLPNIHVSWMQYAMMTLGIMRSTIGPIKESSFLSLTVNPCTFCV